jgi:hypothetical protein
MYDLAAFAEAQGGDGGVRDDDDAVLRERFDRPPGSVRRACRRRAGVPSQAASATQYGRVGR